MNLCFGKHKSYGSTIIIRLFRPKKCIWILFEKDVHMT